MRCLLLLAMYANTGFNKSGHNATAEFGNAGAAISSRQNGSLLYFTLAMITMPLAGYGRCRCD